jgi:pimeloyl-ACP methyl ester carboxylesterase
MAAAQTTDVMHVDVEGITIEVAMRGKGRDILFLNSGSWLADERVFVDRLATLGRVVAPTHPGFGRTDAHARLTSVDDLAYLYLDLIDAMHLDRVLLVGASFGGWIAAEMAVKGDAKISALALIGAFGLKAGGREERTITDVFATPDREIEARSYVQPNLFHKEMRDLSDDEVTRRVRSREGLARFGWSPYMHDPKLPARLHRVQAASLVLRGEADRMVAADCGQLYASRLRGARLVTIPKAAHFPHLEQPDAVLDHLSALLGDNGAGAAIPAQEAV